MVKEISLKSKFVIFTNLFLPDFKVTIPTEQFIAAIRWKPQKNKLDMIHTQPITPELSQFVEKISNYQKSLTPNSATFGFGAIQLLPVWSREGPFVRKFTFDVQKNIKQKQKRL